MTEFRPPGTTPVAPVASPRLPTMRDVAERAGVSRQTVSLVLRGLPGPSEHSREAVLAAAADLGFRANSSARLLRQQRTRLIGMLFTVRNSFEARVAERLLEQAAERGFGVVLGPVTDQRTTEVVVRQLLEQRVEALACYNPDPASPALRQALDLMPVVWLGERSSQPRADVVRTDDDAGLRLVVDHLAGLGHREIAYAGGVGGTVGPDRAATYRAAMTRAGLGAFVDEIPVGFGEEDGAAAARVLLARDHLPTAVIGGSDHCGAGLIATLTRAGVSIPGTISVTGYDDSFVAALSYNDLTSVHQDVDLTVTAILDAIGRRLLDRLTEPVEQATTATLSIRSSTGPARTSAPDRPCVHPTTRG